MVMDCKKWSSVESNKECCDAFAKVNNETKPELTRETIKIKKIIEHINSLHESSKKIAIDLTKLVLSSETFLQASNSQLKISIPLFQSGLNYYMNPNIDNQVITNDSSFSNCRNIARSNSHLTQNASKSLAVGTNTNSTQTKMDSSDVNHAIIEDFLIDNRIFNSQQEFSQTSSSAFSNSIKQLAPNNSNISIHVDPITKNKSSLYCINKGSYNNIEYETEENDWNNSLLLINL